MELSKQVKVSQAITVTAGAAGTTDINGTTLDTANFEGVMIEVTMGAIVSGAVTSIKVQQGDASNLSDAADLEGTAITVADDDDNETFLIDIFKPRKRYVRVVVDRGTQNATVAAASYIQYGPRTLPTSQGTAVTLESHVSPAEGTA